MNFIKKIINKEKLKKILTNHMQCIVFDIFINISALRETGSVFNDESKF